MAQKRYRDAAGFYDRLAAKSEDSSLTVLRYQAARLAGTKNAEKVLVAWLERHPDDVTVRLVRAEQLDADGNAAAAVTEYETILARSPKNVVALNNLAVLYQKQRNPRAEELARAAYDGAPDNPMVADTYGWLLAERGELGQAVGILRKAAAHPAATAEIQYHLASALARKGERDEGLAAAQGHDDERHGRHQGRREPTARGARTMTRRAKVAVRGTRTGVWNENQGHPSCVRSAGCWRSRCWRRGGKTRVTEAPPASPPSSRNTASVPATTCRSSSGTIQSFTVSMPVRPDGLISTPLVQDLKAEGKTPTQLSRDLEQALSQYVRSPTVNVIVTSFVGALSDQVRVVGQAQKPQSLPYRVNMTLLDVMIAVGGLAEYAAGNRAAIVRQENGKQSRIPVRLADLLNDGDINANMTMHPGDVLIIPESRF